VRAAAAAAAAATREKVGTFLLRLPFLVEWRASCHERALRRRMMIDVTMAPVLSCKGSTDRSGGALKRKEQRVSKEVQ